MLSSDDEVFPSQLSPFLFHVGGERERTTQTTISNNYVFNYKYSFLKSQYLVLTLSISLCNILPNLFMYLVTTKSISLSVKLYMVLILLPFLK